MRTSLKLKSLLLVLILSGCGGSNEQANVPILPPSPPPEPPPASACEATTSEVNWTALQTENCERLSQYGLFVDPAQPTRDPNTNGRLYLLTTALFSDYASKYRFLFLPPGSQVNYEEQEAFSFPVGSVLVKTFALPQDSALSGAHNERLIETRLLIHRENGWVALPYLWEGEEARLALAGARVDHQMTHRDQTLTFTYEVPSQPQCKLCHQLNEAGVTRISPIGLKAHLLNRSDATGQAQLESWLGDGWLDRLPEAIPTAAALEDEAASLTARAKGYLDINCAHCHRAEGFASISGLRLGFFQDHTQFSYGICKQPPGYDGGAAGLDYDIVPGHSGASILPYRMSHLEAKDRMPPIGRALVHEKAVDLINRWIDAMDPNLGGCTP
ncbi:SO2930 family diheme c-type cytochrome [Ferrimonas gelatinilytica]|uniref:SO2930 family diheme c-type cytochrome n=1 Tax=Ferrimonas gelatinilytica TaxID=1255257 RepID=A0ABP9S7Q5_9GAMM